MSSATDKQEARSQCERVTVDGAGRIVVPAAVRRALGLSGGDQLTMTFDGSVIELRTVASALKRARALARRHRSDDSSANVVDDFIAERRAEAERD